MDGVFLAGWARKASEGLVGVAKRDGDWCAEIVERYLVTKGHGGGDAKIVLDHLHALLNQRKSRPVDVNGLRALDAMERSFSGKADCIGEFKFSGNQDMLKYIEQGNAQRH